MAENNQFDNLMKSVIGPALIGLCFVALVLAIIKGRFSNSILAWLTVAVLAAFFEGVVIMNSGERFSQGWYIARILSVLSSLAVVIALVLDSIMLYHKVIGQNAKLLSLAMKDELTQLANRRVLNQRLEEEFHRCRRDRTPLSLILIDIDYFKNFNDTHGHVNGDNCLRQVSNILTGCIHRNIDLAARYGGEEFAILLPETSEEGAAHIAEIMRLTIEQTSIVLEQEDTVHITASFGVASMVPGNLSVPNSLIEAADTALYKAKENGRNQVARFGRNWHLQQRTSPLPGSDELLDRPKEN